MCLCYSETKNDVCIVMDKCKIYNLVLNFVEKKGDFFSFYIT